MNTDMNLEAVWGEEGLSTALLIAHKSVLAPVCLLVGTQVPCCAVRPCAAFKHTLIAIHLMEEEEEAWKAQPALIDIYCILSGSWINKGSTLIKKNNNMPFSYDWDKKDIFYSDRVSHMTLCYSVPPISTWSRWGATGCILFHSFLDNSWSPDMRSHWSPTASSHTAAYSHPQKSTSASTVLYKNGSLWMTTWNRKSPQLQGLLS